MVSVFTQRLVVPDETTVERLRKIRKSKNWSQDTLGEMDRLQALAYAQIPEDLIELKIAQIQDRKALQVVGRYYKKIQLCVEDKHIGLFFYGDHGVGKTFLASFVAIKAVERDIPTWFYSYDKLLKDVMNFKDDAIKTRHETIVRETGLLILDGLDSQNASERMRVMLKEKLAYILRTRRNIGATIITAKSNTNNSLFDPYIESLLDEMVYPIHVNGPNLRANACKARFEQII